MSPDMSIAFALNLNRQPPALSANTGEKNLGMSREGGHREIIFLLSIQKQSMS